ncbi:hypothetical protein EVAR_99299_1 [Eumeta japonica]|uniref:Uncharacterized protein n=1 Tax=Eumeta variegata TaxID=151549 RepID=A0A4C1YZE7_EUMVA|nr:hypothetical protein EVAR_99299_1 [Eumeta japonica]
MTTNIVQLSLLFHCRQLHTHTEYRHGVAAYVQRMRVPVARSPPSAHFPSAGHTILSGEADNTLTTPSGLRVLMHGGPGMISSFQRTLHADHVSRLAVPLTSQTASKEIKHSNGVQRRLRAAATSNARPRLMSPPLLRDKAADYSEAKLR